MKKGPKDFLAGPLLPSFLHPINIINEWQKLCVLVGGGLFSLSFLVDWFVGVAILSTLDWFVGGRVGR